jgi:SAM-dependent methyltransferase
VAPIIIALRSHPRTGAADPRRPAARHVLKEALRRRIPVGLTPVLLEGKRRYASVLTRSARRAFTTAQRAPEWLDPGVLPQLQERYRRAVSSCYGYDRDSLERRGAERVRVLAPLLSGPGARSLEVACADGMVSSQLAKAGAQATALDLSDALFDDSVRDAGVRLVQADASDMPFADAEFDLVCSFNAFEHVTDPEAVLTEAIRVTKPGGAIYLLFGPLYWSSYGLHASLSITVPFCHVLFDRPALESYVAERGLEPIPFATLNGWRVGQFRDLWRRHAASLKLEAYREIPSLHGIELVAQHPSCFRSKTDEFDDLLVANIAASFRRLA